MLISSTKKFKFFATLFLLSLFVIITFSTNSFAEINANGYSALTTTSAGTILRVTSDSNDYTFNEDFTVNIDIENPHNYYAEEFTIRYNPDAVKLNSIFTGNSDQLRIYHQSITTSGAATIIVASNGSNSGIKQNQTVLKLNFSSKNISGNFPFWISAAKVADGYGNEFSPILYYKSIYIYSGLYGDVNSDGVVSLGDLGIASRLMGTPSYYWGYYNPDMDNDNYVNTYDLSAIVTEMLK